MKFHIAAKIIYARRRYRTCPAAGGAYSYRDEMMMLITTLVTYYDGETLEAYYINVINIIIINVDGRL